MIPCKKEIPGKVQRPDDRGQMTEDRGQKTEDRGGASFVVVLVLDKGPIHEHKYEYDQECEKGKI